MGQKNKTYQEGHIATTPWDSLQKHGGKQLYSCAQEQTMDVPHSLLIKKKKEISVIQHATIAKSIPLHQITCI